MNWGKSIVLAYVLFALFIGILVTVCVRQNVNLVSADYYKQELAYGQQIRRMENTSQLAVVPAVSLNGNDLVVAFPDFEKVTSGELLLFRPSDARLDKTFTIGAGADTLRYFDVSRMPAGMYKVRLQWQMEGKEYYAEEVINL